MSTLQFIYDNKLVAVIRGANEENAVEIVKALYDGGVKVVEITSETPNFLNVISELSNTFDGDILVGAGTVLDPVTARSAIIAGAKFIFSPTVNTDTIKMAKRYGVVSIPGAMTPTEILTAYESGADIIKVFPAGALGPKYLKDIHGPLPHIPLMPTGGIDVNNIANYFQQGAIAAGIGSSLVNTKKVMDEKELQNITETAKKFVQAIE